ncbi:MATE family efflux transporter [Spirosoma sp.]|uniref:lipopolysaccharide biosynthesis protein n=1 Tax=Spirosoma sp. TaxID=1899569 RepID=UPI002638BAA6|nr:MATE family efflux transporter [Spirosoma sp.]MCX6214044.1 MATE family efflux transporter [Spirosoma sp.]
MKNASIAAFRERIRATHPRTRKAHLNTLFGLAVKGGGIIISLVLVPLTIDYLSKETYGTWLTISSIVTMIALFDIGVGNGLRNKLSEAVTKQDMTLARVYVSTAYAIFGLLQTGFSLLFIVLFSYIPWQKLLNTSIDNEQLQLIILMTAVSMAVKMLLDILSYVLFAIQDSGLAGFINLLSNIVILVGTYLLTKFSNANLFYLGAVTVLSPIVVLLISGFVLYRNKLNMYRPSLKLADFQYAKSLLSLGYKFFFIQMAVVVLFYTDNLIITQLFGPAEVTTYNVAFRYFNSINTVFAIVITPYWSAFTEAYAKSDLNWIKQTYRYLQKLWVGLVIVVILMITVSKSIYSIWIGDRVNISFTLSVCMGIFVIISCWNSVTVTIINGLGKVKLQLYLSAIAALINIPLSIFFGKTLGLGSSGVIIATSFSLLIGSVIGGLQAWKLSTGKATGIWDK